MKISVSLLICLSVVLLTANQVTIYNDNFALVRSSLDLQLEKGIQSYFMDDIPRTIEANSVIINPLKGKIGILSQNYEYDLANTTQILNKYIGKEIEVVAKNEIVFSGTLQFHDFQTIGIIEDNTKKLILIQLSEIQNISLASLPDNFFLKPTLHWKLSADKSGKYPIDFSYLCSGMAWEVTYNTIWNDQDEELIINSWVTINNNTGKSFNDIKLKLIAGEVAKKKMVSGGRSKEVMYSMDAISAKSPEFEEKAFHDFHMYTLSENVTINNNQTKQLELFPVKSVKAASRYEYYTYSNDISSKIVFMNNKKSGLGEPLPKGIVKIYKLDKADDQMEFIGEDNINHTARDEEVILTSGNAFDLVGETSVTASRKISSRSNEKDMSISLRNRSKNEKEIVVIHNLNGDWSITNNNLNYQKKSATKIEFSRKLKAGEEFEIKWTEKINY